MTEQAGGGIYKAMAAILSDVEAIPKAGRGPASAGGYAFRGIDDVMEALHPLFAKHGIFLCPEVLEAATDTYETKNGATMQMCSLRVAWHFYAADGSRVSAVTYGQGSDSSDKAAYKAMAGAMKYAMTQAFVIPTDEVKDPERDDHEAPQRPAGMRSDKRAAAKLAETRGPGEPPGLDQTLRFGKFKGETWRSLMDAAMANPDGGHAEWLRYISDSTDLSKSKPQFADADKRQLAMVRWIIARVDSESPEPPGGVFGGPHPPADEDEVF